MSDDDIRTTMHSKSVGYGYSTSTTGGEDAGPEQRLFAIAARWHMPLQRRADETLQALADNLSLAIEHRIALMLLDLEDIATLDLDEGAT